MTDSKDKPMFTSGPWALDDIDESDGDMAVVMGTAIPNRGVYTSHHRIVIFEGFDDLESEKQQAEILANAALIAAAPDMYEALVQMRAAMDEALREWLGKKGPAADWGIINDALCDSANALRKARGQ